MTLGYFYCYACEIQFQADFGEENKDMKCLTCNSDFIEQITNTEGLSDDVGHVTTAPNLENPVQEESNNNSNDNSTIFSRLSAVQQGQQNGTRVRSSSASDSNRPRTRRELDNISALPGLSSDLDRYQDRLANMGEGVQRPRQEHMIRMEIDPENQTPAQIMQIIQNEIGNLSQLTNSGRTSSTTQNPILVSMQSDGMNQPITMGNFGNLEAMITQLMGQVRNEGRVPASEEIIGSVKSFEMTQKQIDKLCKEGNADCPICMAPWELPAIVKKLPDCTHIFHAECIDAWLRQNSNCPVCRADVKLPSVSLEGGAAGNSAGPHINAQQQTIPAFPMDDLQNLGFPENLAGAIGNVVENLSALTDEVERSQGNNNVQRGNNQEQTPANNNNTTPNPRSSFFNLINRGFSSMFSGNQNRNNNNSQENNNQSSNNENQSNNENNNNNRPRRPRSPGPPSYFS